ncbi:pirin family protein [Nocardioides limicola]|uniref:pirin family protein n=1 Tax=Nocardioides limicola TaxID=2803368 RepID=UPI00193AE4F8|nr:pirin family protein [Nocardioides sp. DJM-14]
MAAEDSPTRRILARVENATHLGGDAQVDDRNVVITPLNPTATDPFLLLSEDWFSSPGFEWHPHRGFETVTLVLDGVLEHGDNLGNAGALTTGDVQWMTAGRGIIHRELAFRNERAHTLQLWVNLPGEMKMVDTRYQDLPAGSRPVIERDGVRIDLVAGDVEGTSGAAQVNWPISGSLLTLEPNRGHDYLLPGRDRAFFYVLSGQVTVGGRAVSAGQIAWSDPVPGAHISAMALATGDSDRPSVVMIYSGEPIREPVSMGGPFVMNTRAEIEQAFRDFHSGKLGNVPRQARLEHL